MGGNHITVFLESQSLLMSGQFQSIRKAVDKIEREVVAIPSYVRSIPIAAFIFTNKSQS